jgi:hypothetical protein
MAMIPLLMFEFIVPAGAKAPVPHYHETVDEVVYGFDTGS